MVDTLENDSIEEQPTIMLPHLVSLSIFFNIVGGGKCHFRIVFLSSKYDKSSSILGIYGKIREER